MTNSRLTTAYLNNLKPNPTNAKSTDYEVNLSAMKDSGLPTGVRCLVGKSGNKRFLLRYTSPVTGKKASIGLGKHPETDIPTLRKLAKEYRQQILESIDLKLERDNQAGGSLRVWSSSDSVPETCNLDLIESQIMVFYIRSYPSKYSQL